MVIRNQEQLLDKQFLFVKKDNPFELEHRYGPNVHVLNEPMLHTILARMGDPGGSHYEKLTLVDRFYRIMLNYVAHGHLERVVVRQPTPMARSEGKLGHFVGPVIDPEADLVLVSVIRGGVYPTERLKEALAFVTAQRVRTDYVTMERRPGPDGHVRDILVSGMKVAGPVSGKTVLIPDPMGATGSTMRECYRIYTGQAGEVCGHMLGGARKIIAMHFVTAPEYLRQMTQECPELIVYTGRVDRGLSPPATFQTPLGTTDDERGLNDVDYIVPGLGGVGEILSGE